MESRKSFEGIHEDYAFFLAHSTESGACRAALHRAIRVRAAQHPIRRWLDFGCGGGEFLASLMTEWPGNLTEVEMALVDVDTAYLESSTAIARARCPSVCSATSLQGIPGDFDLITSNHVLYYVPNLADTLHSLRAKLTDRGQALLVIGGLDNQLVHLWEQAYRAAGVTLPFLHAEHVATSLVEMAIPHQQTSIQSLLRFPDTLDNRTKLLRFLFKEWLPRLGEECLLPLMDPYRQEGDIVMENRDLLFSFPHFAFRF